MTLDAVTPNKLWHLKRIRLFDGLSPAELQEMERITRMQEVKKRQPLYSPGDPSSNVYLLKQGRVKIASTAPSGKEVTFEILEPGEVFGELEVLEETTRETGAEALDDTLLCVIRREDFEQYLRTHPDLSVKLTKVIGLRLRKIQSRVEDLVFRDVPARLAHILLEMSKTDGVPEGPGIRIKVRLTRQELANLIGCSRETVSTTLGQFREQGVIRIEGRSITVLDHDHLARLVSSRWRSQGWSAQLSAVSLHFHPHHSLPHATGEEWGRAGKLCGLYLPTRRSTSVTS
jgi:CRP-like cAMP-binding protein